MQEFDCRGLACPQPVLRTKDALDETASGRIGVLVDNEAAVGNVTRFARSQGCSVETRPVGSDFLLEITREGPADGPAPDIVCAAPEPEARAGAPRLVVKISNQFMGAGSDELGRILMLAFLKSLADTSPLPAAIVFYNSGVLLTCRGSAHLDALRELEQKGVPLFSCGTCLDFFNLNDELAIGVVTNMFEIIETLSGADRVVSP